MLKSIACEICGNRRYLGYPCRVCKSSLYSKQTDVKQLLVRKVGGRLGVAWSRRQLNRLPDDDCDLD